MTKKLVMCIVAIIALFAPLVAGCTTSVSEPVTLKFIIRTEDERKPMGEYVATVLEDLGFDVEIMYKTSREASPIWRGSNPADGLWHCYTGGWVSTQVERDEGSNFGTYYTPLFSAMGPLWAAYTPAFDFYEVAKKLWYNEFTTLDERRDLFAQALPMSMTDSARVWLVDRRSFQPVRSNVAVASDKAGGIYGSWMWAQTLHLQDDTGKPLAPTNSTLIKVGTADLVVDPWNPVAGSNWAYDRLPQVGTGDLGLAVDTRDGHRWPMRLQKAEVTVKSGLPVVLTPGQESWLTLSTSPAAIAVPATAWSDWNAQTQQWIPAGSGKTALCKVVAYYPKDIFTLPLHDGSTLSPADFLLFAAMQFDRAKPDSPIYDENYVEEFDALMAHFKGVEFNFNDPNYGLIVTTYDDAYYLDADWNVQFTATGGVSGATWFPVSNYGQYAWHTVALGMLAERDGQLAFGDAKATDKDVEWTSFIGGPSLDILSAHLTAVQTSGDPDYAFIPYKNLLGTYVTQAQALQRYQNLQSWYNARKNFWVASGPFYLNSVDTTAQIVDIKKFASYPDDGTKWFFMLDPSPAKPWPSIKGAWVDEVSISVVPQTQAVTQLQSNTIQVYAFAIADKDIYAQAVAAAPAVKYYWSYGSFNELTLNPSGPIFQGTGKLNPFAIPAIREALNWAIDRDYVCGTVLGGMAFPRYTCIGTQWQDYLKYAGEIYIIEDDYAYNLAQADTAIETAMLAIPGVTREGGKYYYTPPSA